MRILHALYVHMCTNLYWNTRIIIKILEHGKKCCIIVITLIVSWRTPSKDDMHNPLARKQPVRWYHHNCAPQTRTKYIMIINIFVRYYVFPSCNTQNKAAFWLTHQSGHNQHAYYKLVFDYIRALQYPYLLGCAWILS